ncbi:serine/threonine-protein kinase/endoribonuclease IRE1a-like [Helianthus annuus]|uniref:serine/threonine-protein kinase/endoribonuclease IRE1a-like n=1 Tax=Helianthus annuus TaxID=4232 RepID=UPI000B8FD8E7|nr:serine/threonine-protein kinase/endoribonuclease IRE1a-like [Helianthus annuus]XP_022015157.1 serine/threonine-protein kinase/endoribonuclease IRE1a-like [Helianthus annuus]XP_035839998.1 serine/threonine-protein kinase/endoribonuclease IRE1a-like [Helianthus annuus]
MDGSSIFGLISLIFFKDFSRNPLISKSKHLIDARILDARSQTRAMDMFSLGCVLFFCMTSGKHPFGDTPPERDTNVINNKMNLSLLEHIPEAGDLCSQLLNHDPKLRPNASEVLSHPLFWDSETRMSFLKDASDWVEPKRKIPGSIVCLTLETEGCVAFRTRWDVGMEPKFISRMEHRLKPYCYDKVLCLLRIIRNTMNHYDELDDDIKNSLGSKPEGLDDYFRTKFPKLLIKVYNVMYKLCKNEEWFRKYL